MNDRRGRPHQKSSKRIRKIGKKCEYCGELLKCRGASNTIGSISWKCRSRKCGRTTWERGLVIAPYPICYVSRI